MSSKTADAPAASPRRIFAIDALRGAALVAMAIYHTAWDLGFYGYVDPSMATTGGWKLFARAIASSFLVLVGVSLWLAHRDGIRFRAFGKRVAQVAAGAVAITVATWIALPQGFVFFGILHQIVFASVAGLAFLRLPWWAVALAGFTIIAIGNGAMAPPSIDWPPLVWLGLTSVQPRSNDFVPVFPWFGAVLCGLALAKAAHSAGWPKRDTASQSDSAKPRMPMRALGFLGRHGLVFYLAHQPVILALLWVLTQIAPPDRVASFNRLCVRQCVEAQSGRGWCEAYCACAIAGLESRGLFDEVYRGKRGRGDEQVEAVIEQCSAEATPQEDGGNEQTDR